MDSEPEKKSLLERIGGKIKSSNIVEGLMSNPIGEPERLEPTDSPYGTTIPLSKSTRSALQDWVKSSRFRNYDEGIMWLVRFVGKVPVAVIHSNLKLEYDGKVQVELRVNDKDAKTGS